MRTKPTVIGLSATLLAGVFLVGASSTPAFADAPTLVLYPRTLNNPDDIHALVDLRKKLRADGQFVVMSYDPASAAMIRAAADAHHPELLTGSMSADADRSVLTRALGASFSVVVARAGGRGKTDVHLVEAAPSARFWNIFDKKTDDAAQAVERQAADALQHPGLVAVAPAPPKPISPPVAPTPKPVAAPPSVTVPPMVTTIPAPKPLAPPVATVVAPVTVPKLVLPPITPPTVVQSPPAAIIAPSSPPTPAPVKVPVAAPAAPPVDDLSAIQGPLRQGDSQLAVGNFVGAIARYREAINGAPLSPTPRLKLAQAYLEADMRDKALDEAKRALEIVPCSVALQQFLVQLDAQTGSADGAVARFSALVAQNPQDPTAHLELGDAYWNNGALEQAEDEYKAAQPLAGTGTPISQTASAHLARLYAAQMRYDDSLAALKDAGPGGYALALGIVQSRADTLTSTLESAQDAFTAGKTTHAGFYKTAGDVSAQAQTLADFVIKVTPPPAFKLSHLYRIQATHLLAQQAAVLVTYIETSDEAQSEKAAQLGKEAQAEMLTAHAAEQKLGLWGGKQAEAKN